MGREEMRLRKQNNQIEILFNRQRGATMMTDEIDDAIAAWGIDPGRLYDQVQLGEKLRLTVAEYLQFKKLTGSFPSAFIPAGLTKRGAKAIRDEFNRPERNADERKRKAAKAADRADCVQKVADLDCRASAVFTMLTDKWKPAHQLAKTLKHSPAFQPLSGPSLKKAIQRVLDKLVASGRVEMTRDRSKNGLPMNLFRLR
jgi:hypothetical protein